MRAQGFSEEVFDGRPVIGICNTWSELTPCNAHLRRLGFRTSREMEDERNALRALRGDFAEPAGNGARGKRGTAKS
jgi:dihydroxyacid dehydratase/phosphogluconate dehydratase